MIPSDRSHLFVAATSHPGMSGKNNEDNYAVSAHYIDETKTISSLFAIVADGIGGHQAGEIASEIATETISKIIIESDAKFPPDILGKAILEASTLIYQQTNADSDQMGMGSTCVCVWILDDRLYTAYVGDSRIYLIRDGEIRQITVDHSWVQEAIEHGIITPDQAKNHPRAHVIRRYLGSAKPVEPDFRLKLAQDELEEQSIANQGTKLFSGDQLLLCSDGLTDLVTDSEISEYIQRGDLEKSVHDLVDLANERGGHDNITIIALEFPPVVEKKPAKITENRKQKKSRQPIFFALLILILAAVALGTVLFLYISRSKPIIQPTLTATIFEISDPSPIPPTIELASTPTVAPTDAPVKPTYTPWPTHTTQP